MGTSPRRPRRAVRPSGTVGTDESVLRSVLPAADGADGAGAAGRPSSTDDAGGAGAPGAGTPGAGTRGTDPSHGRTAATGARGTAPSARRPARAPRRAVGGTPAAASDDLWRTTRSADDSDQGWGRPEPTSNDERLLREKPPHW